MPHTFDPTIIREYDIRGTVGKNLNEGDAVALGKAFGTMTLRAGGKRIVVGYDGRTHSPMFEAALVKGLISTGAVVERVGLGPTPMLYFAAAEGKADAGIMVTGSHNPPDQNGFKMLLAKNLVGGGSVYGAAIKKLADMAAADDFAVGEGSVSTADVSEAYIARLLQDYQGAKPLNIVWDCGNGASGDIVRRLTAKLPGTHTLLFDAIDGTFPNHHPDPTEPHNLVDLQKAVAEKKADLGIAFDGDADRIGAVDGRGRIVAGDQLLAIYASEVLAAHPGATIIADVKASQALFDRVAELGGNPVMGKTGHSLIKAKMAETHALLAGEMSGHMFFADKYYGYDDAIYSAVRLASLMSASGKSLAEWRDSLPQTINTPEMRIPVEESRKFVVVDEVKARLLAAKAKVNDTDGVRVLTDDGWWLLRASNTQAALIARAESQSEEGLARLKAVLAEQLRASGLQCAI
ncbi:MAG: phosphomannomutase/phosphoglucomutase [Alphaproteobacteria bacterium]|nr:phosphomannomutase/phosphoglucomutase [Alphaproteobacteria bacterium]